MLWYLETPERFQRERDAIEAIETEVTWLQGANWKLAGQQLNVDADIIIEDTTYGIRLTYPIHFPAIPPILKPRDTSQHWSAHQYRNGELCLEWGPDNWDPAITGADMLQSAHRLLSKERHSGSETPAPVPSRHLTSLGQDFRVEVSRFALTQGSMSQLEKIPPDSRYTTDFLLGFRGDYWVTLLRGIASDPAWNNPDLPAELDDLMMKLSGLLLSLPTESKTPNIQTPTQLEEFLTSVGTDLTKVWGSMNGAGDLPPILLLRTGKRPFQFFFIFNDSIRCIPTLAMPGQPSETRSGNLPEQLAGKKVGIVGLGSAGSKIASSLARSGVLSFALVDDDLLFPENLCRHQGTWSEIGLHKVDAVKHQIRLVSPLVVVSTNRVALSGQESSTTVAAVLSNLASCDLLIDATANSEIFCLLSELTSKNKQPLVWLEVYGGGLGGLVARSRPGFDPEGIEGRRRLDAWLASQEATAPPTTNPYTTKVGEETFIASDADVTLISSIATQVALDILSGVTPSRFPSSAYFVGMSSEWIFSQPLAVQPIDLGGPVAAEDSEPKAIIRSDTQEHLAAILLAGLSKDTK